MPSAHATLAPLVSAAIESAFGPDHRDADAVLRSSQFADLQSNAALPLGKRLGMPPRDVAKRIVGALDVREICDRVEISGPGFINLSLSGAWLGSTLSDLAADPRKGVPEPTPERIVIDYSAPNVAKEMHVGHLRTTVVGDALADHPDTSLVFAGTVGPMADSHHMENDRPVWFLDVDGVVSPFGVGADWSGAFLYADRGGDIGVPFRQEVVEAVSQLHAARVVEVRWLTTWDAELLEAWEDVGFGPFRVADRADVGRRRWWKANVVEQWLACSPARKAVWTDDDLTPGRLRGFDRGRLLAFAPDHEVGLTMPDVLRIERWVVTPDQPS